MAQTPRAALTLTGDAGMTDSTEFTAWG